MPQQQQRDIDEPVNPNPWILCRLHVDRALYEMNVQYRGIKWDGIEALLRMLLLYRHLNLLHRYGIVDQEGGEIMRVFSNVHRVVFPEFNKKELYFDFGETLQKFRDRRPIDLNFRARAIRFTELFLDALRRRDK